ncbi:MAG: enamine deaminase RidA [Alphaproteobacteria bacterium]|nr:enamine deaminase RidA [Alphaproteobacteria bacterium]|tara:strand:- start:783 stop:1187 length:405 start_codon:yes stop_codon:yes gene_type:complete
MTDSNLVVDRPRVTGFGAPVAAYSSVVGVRGGRILFIAGKGPVDENGKTISDDIESQVRQAMKNMKATLEVAGAGMEHVVKVNAYFTTNEAIPHWKQVRLENFPSDFPAATAVIVAGLAIDDWQVEIEAYAAVP